MIRGEKVIAIKKPSKVLLGLTLAKSFVLPNFLPPKKARESISTLINTIIKSAVLLVRSIPKCTRIDVSWLIKKNNEAKKPRWIEMPDINQTRFLCNKGLLTGKLIIRKNNTK